jgi:hypothetical protein
MSFMVRDLMIGVLPETDDGARPGLQLCGEVTRDQGEDDCGEVTRNQVTEAAPEAGLALLQDQLRQALAGHRPAAGL